jgi:tetratricopeptide (TPR) repeat protein
MRIALRATLLGVGWCLTASTLHAQRTKRPARASTPAAPGGSVRAELASVLLQSGRYDEAAREYRVLLARDPSNFDYRLGLVHALAWGDHPRDAERELVELLAKRPGAPELDSLLRVVRDAYDPRAVDAADWVAKDPSYAPYRLALARALAREHMPRLAIAHFDTLLSHPSTGPLPGRGVLLREMADAYIASDDRAGGAERLRAALALSPTDTTLRHTLASMLADARRYEDAKAQYDTLILQEPSAGLLLDRARIRLSLGDRAGAEADLWASVGLQPSSSAYLLLGDLYRERGDYRGARSMYVAARLGAPSDVRTAVSAALAQLDREERPAILAPLVGDDPGWRLTEDAAADNLGVAYSALSLRRIIPVTTTTHIALGTEWRQLAERTSRRRIDASGFGATAGAWQEVAYGPLLGRLQLEGGAIHHPLGGTLGEARGAMSAWASAWQATVELARAAAYPSLFSVDALLPPEGGTALIERDAAITLGGPVGAFDVGLRWQQSVISDDNRRTTVDGSLRYALGGKLFAVYAFNTVAFAERSPLYWDPDRYVSQSAGIEYAVRQARGLSFAARLLPSYAMSDEAPVLPGTAPGGTPVARGALVHHAALQFGAGAELGYRVHAWEVAGALSYGRGRAGDYQRVGASITLRMVP